MSRRAGASTLLLLCLPLAVAACGREGPPVAPERRLPAAVQDLSVTVLGEGVQLQWTLPRIRVDRSPLRNLRRTEVYRRLESSEAEPAPTRPAVLTFRGLFGPPGGVVGFDRIADILLAEPAPAEVLGDRVIYMDTQALELGQRYTYVVVAVDEQGRTSPPSNRAVAGVSAPPQPPSELEAQPGDRQVRLSWSPPTALEDGSPVTGDLLYDVFRTTTPEARPVRPLNPEPIVTPSYVDLTVENDTAYYYTVRALLDPRGPASQPVRPSTAATPEDRTPPASPRGLVVAVAGRTVRLAWEPVTDLDLAGYHVYRRTGTARDWERLTPAVQEPTTYVDTERQRGQTYHYMVTAVDRARRANESVPSAEATATVP